MTRGESYRYQNLEELAKQDPIKHKRLGNDSRSDRTIHGTLTTLTTVAEAAILEAPLPQPIKAVVAVAVGLVTAGTGGLTLRDHLRIRRVEATKRRRGP